MNRKENFKIFQENTKKKVLQSEDEFLKLLTVIGKNQRYNYSAQLSIYSKNPKAVSCADFKTWEESFNRVVRKWQKGILIEDENGEFLHIFDITQTVVKNNIEKKSYYNYHDYIWKFQDKDKDVIKDIVSENSLKPSDSLIENIEILSEKYKNIYLADALRNTEIKDISSFDKFLNKCITYSVAKRFNIVYDLDMESFKKNFSKLNIKSLDSLGILVSKASEDIIEIKATAIPLDLDGGLR